MSGDSGDQAREDGPGGNPRRNGDDSKKAPSGPGAGRRPQKPGPGPKGPPQSSGKKPTSPIRLKPIGNQRFELGHPSCVEEAELDYEEGLEIWKAGDPEGARDALRYALAACRDNAWVHVALGRIALEEFRDPTLARGHFGYAVSLCERAVAPPFKGILPVDRPNNRPFYDAIDGLLRCLDALGQAKEAAELRAMRERLSGSRPQRGGGPSRRPDPGV